MFSMLSIHSFILRINALIFVTSKFIIKRRFLCIFRKLMFFCCMVVAHILIPALGKQRQADLWLGGQPGLQSEFQDSQGCCYTEKTYLKGKNWFFMSNLESSSEPMFWILVNPNIELPSYSNAIFTEEQQEVYLKVCDKDTPQIYANHFFCV